MSGEKHIERKQCSAFIYKPEHLRRTGRGRSGFERHYTRERCKRKAVKHQKLCWQHISEDPMLICGHFKSEACMCAENY